MSVFKSLNRDDLYEIVEYESRKLRERLSHQHLELELSTEAKDFLIDKGYNPDFGARPLRRAIEQYIEDPISEEILRGSYKGKNKLLVEVKTDTNEDGEEIKRLFFETTDLPDPEADEAPVVEVTEGS